jgi:tetratricopeptide (TPR) repeat protein
MRVAREALPRLIGQRHRRATCSERLTLVRLRRDSVGLYSVALPAVQLFEQGDVEGAKDAAASILADPKKSRYAITRLYARSLLLSNEDPDAELDSDLIDATRRDIRVAFGRWWWVANEYRFGIRLYNAELFEGALLIFEDVLPRQATEQRFARAKYRQDQLRHTRAYLAQCYGYVGRSDEAVVIQREVCDYADEFYGASDPRSIEARYDLGMWLLDGDHADEALGELQRVSDLAHERSGISELGKYTAWLGRARMEVGDTAGAVDALTTALPLLVATWGTDSLPAEKCREWLERAQSERP